MVSFEHRLVKVNRGKLLINTKGGCTLVLHNYQIDRTWKRYRVSMASVASIFSGEKLADLISATYHYKEW